MPKHIVNTEAIVTDEISFFSNMAIDMNVAKIGSHALISKAMLELIQAYAVFVVMFPNRFPRITITITDFDSELNVFKTDIIKTFWKACIQTTPITPKPCCKNVRSIQRRSLNGGVVPYLSIGPSSSITFFNAILYTVYFDCFQMMWG